MRALEAITGLSQRPQRTQRKPRNKFLFVGEAPTNKKACFEKRRASIKIEMFLSQSPQRSQRKSRNKFFFVGETPTKKGFCASVILHERVFWRISLSLILQK
jgi:hypothetical protein